MSDLKIEEVKIYEDCQVGKHTRMSYKMFQHLTHTFELRLMDFMRLMQGVIIEGMSDGQAGGYPNIEQPIVVRKKQLKNISDYGIILPIWVPSHIFEFFTIQKHDVVFGEIDINVSFSMLNISYKMYILDIALHNILHVDKSDICRWKCA